MRQALEQAKKAESLGEVPVGAVLVKDDEMISGGFNQPIAQKDATAHAEIMAIRQAGQHLDNYRLLNTTLYVTLEPCAMCAMALVHARISKLVYATKEPRTGADGSLYQLLNHAGHNHKISVTSGVLAEEASQMLTSFFRKKRQSKDY